VNGILTVLGTTRFWFDLLQIIGINILLSGDNAVVIALASRSLPEAQRKWAVIGGSAAAVILRIILCLIIASVLQIPYLKLIGGLLLVYIGVKLVIAEEQTEEEIAAKSNLLGAIQTILIADAVMSLDNVVAIAAAAHDSVLLITLGLLISIPLIVFGSQLMLRVLGKYPILVSLGGGLLGWLAGEIILSDPIVEAHLPYDVHTVGQIAKPLLAIIVIALGMIMTRRQRQRQQRS
jgi:YjbE family integral membrane protein